MEVFLASAVLESMMLGMNDDLRTNRAAAIALDGVAVLPGHEIVPLCLPSSVFIGYNALLGLSSGTRVTASPMECQVHLLH